MSTKQCEWLHSFSFEGPCMVCGEPFPAPARDDRSGCVAANIGVQCDLDDGHYGVHKHTFPNGGTLGWRPAFSDEAAPGAGSDG